MTTKRSVQVRPGPLPETPDDLIKLNPRSMLERVKYLMINGAYAKMKPYLEATSDESAVEGKIIWDRSKAADILRDCAKDEHDDVVANLNLADADHMIGLASNSLGIGRKQRAKAMLQQVPPLPDADGQPITV
jgi:hypothetical protein